MALPISNRVDPVRSTLLGTKPHVLLNNSSIIRHHIINQSGALGSLLLTG